MLWYSYLKLRKDSQVLRDADPEMLSGLAECEIPKSAEGITALSDRFSALAQAIRMNGVCKMTWRGRLKETERVLCKYLDDLKQKEISFLDLGASDGSTTREAVEALRQMPGVKVEARMIDLNLWLYRYRKGWLTEYREAGGEPVLVRIGPLCIRLDSGMGHVLSKHYLLKLGWIRRRMTAAGRILLVNPLTANDPDITIEAGDCMEYRPELENRFDAIRSSNLLIHAYFTEDQMLVAVGYLHRYLRDGGLLVLSRNEPQGEGEIELGSIWRKEGGVLRRLEDFGGGSEIRDLVDGYPTAHVHKQGVSIG
jgi:hypothetical protein